LYRKQNGGMEILMIIKRDNVIYKFDKNNTPVVKTDLPAELTFETIDCFNGCILDESKVLADVDYSRCNPATGPVYFNGVKIGDVLEIKITKIKCISPGYTMAVHNDGLLAEYVHKDVTKILKFDEEHWYFDNMKFKLTPMIGVIGVTPADKVISTVLPGDHGGNIDTTLIKEGATAFLPVFVDGGLLVMGDLHAAMGDGESFYMGLEVAGEVEVEVKVRRDIKIDVPFVLADNRFASIATDIDADAALKKAMKKLVDFVVDHSSLDFYEAGIICGLTADLQISQMVDPEKTARMAIDVSVLKEIGIEL